MKFLKILLKAFFCFFISLLINLLRIRTRLLENYRNHQSSSQVSRLLSWYRRIAGKVALSKFFKITFQSIHSVGVKTINSKINVNFFNDRVSDNLYLINLLSFFLRFNMTKDFEDILLKTLKFNALKNQEVFSLSSVKNLNDKNLIDSFENKNVSQTTSRVFLGEHNMKTSNNYNKNIENVFVHNYSDSFDFLSKKSSTAINFTALQDLYNYLKLFNDEGKLTDYPASLQTVKPSVRKKYRIPKNFRGGSLVKDNVFNNMNKILIPKESLQRQVNVLKEVEFLLKNRDLFETNELKLEDLNISHEVKKVMFSQYNPAAPYGADAKLYTSDLFSKNKLIVARRIALNQVSKPVNDFASFEKNVGFLNSNLSSDEEWENSSDVPLGGWFTGEFFFINPFVVLGFIVYSFLELFCLVYFMSFFFGNPIDTFLFFLKYPLVYFYENLSSFPSPNYFFSALMFWFAICYFFNVHLLELIDEERFDPPKFSWLYNFSKEFLYSFLLGWCVLFCTLELIGFFDLLLTRVFFLGVPGYPNIFSIIFLFFYDIFYVLGSVGYFSFYLDHVLYIDIKFPSFYFSESAPLTQRYPLVQPYFIASPFFDRPNFFLWLANSFLDFFTDVKTEKSFFLENHAYFVYQRELVQDIRKYNYLRKNLLELRFLGQLHSRGWNGFNYRLDLQTFIDPIIPSEQVIRFDWRLKNSHSNGIRSRLFNSINFGLDANRNFSVKRLKTFAGPSYADRHGYFDYIDSYFVQRDTDDWFDDGTEDKEDKKKEVRKKLNNTPIGFKKSIPEDDDVSSFFFNAPASKFESMLDLNLLIQSKFDRDFEYSQLYGSFWSYFPGNNEPKKYFRYNPFIPFESFSNLQTKNYFFDRLSSTNILSKFNKYFSFHKYHLHNTFLKDPAALFPTDLIDERNFLLNSNYDSENTLSQFQNRRKKFSSKDQDLKLFDTKQRQSRSFSSTEKQFLFDLADPSQLKHRSNAKYSNDVSSYLRKGVNAKEKMESTKKLVRKKIDIGAIPDFPYKANVKTKFISKLFQNFKPFYLVKHTSSFTTFSRLDNFNSVSLYPESSGLFYPFGIFFSGFGRLFSGDSPVKLFSFDYYYAKNHNFLYSIIDNSLKQHQFRVMLTSKARFAHPLKGGYKHHSNFLYPMLSELRLKEKLLPFDFYYLTPVLKNYQHLRLDPYESIRKSTRVKGSCYFLDARIQNWLHFNNVIWNDYFHFFFNRSFKTEGSGSKFFLASYNPINGPVSYKLFIDSPTLESPKVGQFFYNYISWLQYKFKWLLHPTSTYKRFDSFRFMQQHSNKKFYFTSLLKFYQTNLFRWQQGAQIFQWNQIQSRNFLIHLFFHKYQILFNLKEIKNVFDSLLTSNFSQKKNTNSLVLNNLDSFNSSFFNIMEDSEFQKSVGSSLEGSTHYRMPSELFIPSFTVNDFRFFQYVIDLRRWKALQTSYIRDWKFEEYMKYLGPILYKEDVASLMGFFAPFEYRNQIIVSRMRNDSLRFSVFFPKKVIDEQFAHPMKRLTFPLQKFKPAVSKYGMQLNNSKPSYYAFVINRPFFLTGSNYSIFSKKGKKFISGLYSNLNRFDSYSKFNVVSGDFASVNNTAFYDFSDKKKKFLRDKNYWFSKVYELQEIRNRLQHKTKSSNDNNRVVNSHSVEKSDVILDQLGKPLNLDIPMTIPRLPTIEKSKINLTDQQNFVPITSQRTLSNFYFSLLPKLYPDLFIRFGGPKAHSSRWHKGQSWLKFVVASQNVSVYPVNRDRRKKLSSNLATSRHIIHSKGSFHNFGHKIFQNKFLKTPQIKRKHGFFNFGLSGIGRLPRLSRSFFHMLFFRNKLDDFKKLKTEFLKIYLMSIPLFYGNTTMDFNKNVSFNTFWTLLLGFSDSKLSNFKLRYAFLFNMLFGYRQNLNFSDFIFHPNFGTLVSVYSNDSLQASKVLLLSDQYKNFKSYNRFRFFNDYSGFIQGQTLTSIKNNSSVPFIFNHNSNSSLGSFKSLFGFSFYNTFVYSALHLINSGLKKLSEFLAFNFIEYVLIKPIILTSKNDNFSIYITDNITKSELTSGLSEDYSKTFFLNKFYSKDSVISLSEMKSKLFYGTFRSSLHWYVYPVHYFFASHYFISSALGDFFSQILSFGLKVNFKYLGFLFFHNNELYGSMFKSFGFYNNYNLSAFTFSQGASSYAQLGFKIKEDSLVFVSFSKSYSDLFCFVPENSFKIKIKNRFKHLEFIQNLFSFQITKADLRKYFITYNSFFFNVDFLFGISKFTSQLHSNILNSSKLNNLFLGFENFLDDLNFLIISIDGSGRHNRPKTVAQTLNQIFTYREYEKYRHEHHRQRFRAISPHWIQNSFKNRAGFKYYYLSPDTIRRKLNRRLLSSMFKYSAISRSTVSPSNLNRISYINVTPNPALLNNLFHLNNLNDKDITFKDTSFSNRFSDETTSTFNPLMLSNSRNRYDRLLPYHSDSFAYNFTTFPDLYNLRVQRGNPFWKNQFDEWDLPDFYAQPKDKDWQMDTIDHKHRKKNYLHHQRYGNPFSGRSFRKFSDDIKNKLKENNSPFSHLVGIHKSLLGSQESLFKGFTEMNKNYADQFSFLNVANENNVVYSPTNLMWTRRTGFNVGGGNFINLKNSFSMNTLFQTPVSHSKRRVGGSFAPAYSASSHSEVSDSFTPGMQKRKRSIKASMQEPYYRISPRYLRALKTRKGLQGIYTNSVGGISSRAKFNRYVYPLVGGKSHLRKYKHLQKYPSNVKRFIRPVSKVIMQVPYLYSKWYTQNPRLSYSVDNNLIKIFSNNQFDELNFICVQSLFLLKRKIMFNVITLKLMSHKNKLLYFYIFDNVNDEINILNSHSNIKFNENKNNFIFVLLNRLCSFGATSIDYLLNLNFFFLFYKLRAFFIDLFFGHQFFYVRLLNNPLVQRFSHESDISDDLLFFEDFYYKQTAKRVLSEIAFAGHSSGGWNNPLGLSGQYIPGLSFYAKGAINFNFNYQNPDFFSSRSFSPEMLVDNNLIRQNSNIFDRNFFFNEFPVTSLYRKRWHFLAYRISSPISPFIEYERPHNLVFPNRVRYRHARMPMLSLRRVHNVYPNHLKSFFDGLISDYHTFNVHDITFPFKLKLLNMQLREDPIYLRKLYSNLAISFKEKPFLSDRFLNSLNSKQFKVLTDFYNRMNLSSLVNKRRLGFRRNVWTPFRYNFYYKFNWRSFLHKYSTDDLIGYRRYKLNPYFDLYNGPITFSLKSRAFQHLIVSQIPRFELDSRRRVPLNFSSQDFVLLFFHYFNYVNENFYDKGYQELGKKIFKYVNRKVHPYLFTYLYEGNRRHRSNFWNIYDSLIRKKIADNEANFYFAKRVSKASLKLPNYVLKSSVTPDLMNQNKRSIDTLFFSPGSSLSNKKDALSYTQSLNRYLFKRFLTSSKKIIYSWSGRSFRFFMVKENPIYYLVQRKLSDSNLNFTQYFKNAMKSYDFDKFVFLYMIFEHDPLSFYRVVRFFDFRWMRYPFLLQFFSRPTRMTAMSPQPFYSFKKNARYNLIREFFSPYVSISRIHGIYSLYNLKKHRERSLNPRAWLAFDLFSRIRPAFKPFLFKFSKHFMLSKFVPAKGISSYNHFIKSHTAFDNFFENHPYLSFAFGLKTDNRLINSESMYKELRKRSYMLDFSRRHHKIANPINYSQVFKRGSKVRAKFLQFYNFSHLFSHPNAGRGKRRTLLKNKTKFLHLTNKMSSHFSSYYNNEEVDLIKGHDLMPREGSEIFSEALGVHSPKKFLRSMRTLPLFFRYKGLFTNSNYYSVMVMPRRKIFFFNVALVRPYNALLKFVRYDNYFFPDYRFLSKFVVKYGSLNLVNSFRYRNYYQPNLKVFFDFNAYKERYNLGLLFRGLSFEDDFSFFLFRRMKFLADATDSFSLAQVSNSDAYLISDFTKFSISNYFNLLVNKNGSSKGYLVESKMDEFLFFLDKFILKLNPVYLVLVFLDCYLVLFYSLFSLVRYFYFFDFSFFINFFQLDNSFVYYIPRRPLFHAFFHFAIFREYLKFSWLFSLKFLIFNIEYYPYYFMIFSFLIILRVISFNVSKANTVHSPLAIPHLWRFSDLQLNSNNGWFDAAWNEVKHEALDRLYSLHMHNKIDLAHDHLLTFDDIKKIKRKFGIHKKDNTFFEPEDSNTKINLDLYENLSRTDKIFQKPFGVINLKRILSRFWSPSFLLPSKTISNADKLKLLDADNTNFPPVADVELLRPDKVDLSVASSLNIKRDDSKFSFFLFRKQLELLLTGKLTFFNFLNSLNFGFRKFSDRKTAYIDNYDVDDFSEEFFRLFLPASNEFSVFTANNLKKRRMAPEDENIHFYRKPGSIYQSELLLRKTGVENDQLYYIVEFPGKFNNTFINAFSRAYAVKNLNSNFPYYGFFTFSKNAKLPTNFEEFVAFCSNGQNLSSTHTNKPNDLSLEPNLERMRTLWSLFQYVVRYDYNMFNEFNMDDQHLFDLISHIEQKDQYTLLDNLKFWSNKALVDSIDANFLNRKFFSNMTSVNRNEVRSFGEMSSDDEDFTDRYFGDESSALGTLTPTYSFLYVFYTYLFLFVFFLFLSFLFCVFFLFLFFLYNYVSFFF